MEFVVAEQKFRKMRSNEKNNICKNAELTEMKRDVSDYKTREFTFKWENNGCKNMRRYGSAWCQECSDKFKSA